MDEKNRKDVKSGLKVDIVLKKIHAQGILSILV